MGQARMWRLRGVGVLLVGVLLAGCQADPAGVDRPRLDESLRTAMPPSLETDQLRPLEGAELERAEKPLDEVLASLDRPDYLQVEADPTAVDRSEPPLEAQRAYARGRLAWREGNGQAAVEHFDRALQAAPDEPAILRSLGRLALAMGNPVRAVDYLQRVVAADPHDLFSVYLLGQQWLQREQWEQAAVLLGHALALHESGHDASRLPRAVIQHDLAAALVRLGHLRAALEQYEGYFDGAAELRQLAERGEDLAMLGQQEGELWRLLGDIHHQLDEPEQAYEAYQHAAEHLPAQALTERLVYTHLRLGRIDEARQLVIEHVGEASADPTSLELAAYLRELGVPVEDLARRLQRMYDEQGRPAELAIAAANLLERDQASQFLQEHLREHPDHQEVFDELLARLLPAEAAQLDPERLGEAVSITADLLEAAPDRADTLAISLFRAVGDARLIRRAIEAWPTERRDAPAVRLIHGIALVQLDRPAEAAEAFEHAIDAGIDLDLARRHLARLHMREGDYQRAGELLEPLAGRADPEIATMRAEILARTGRLEEALALIDEALDQLPAGEDALPLVLEQASLHLRGGDFEQAEQALLDALNREPENERLYARLFELYGQWERFNGDAQARQEKWSRLVRRLLGTIPDSRIGRLIRAELLDARGQTQAAESLLRELLAEDATDLEALGQLLEVYRRSNRQEQARELLGRYLDRRPRDRGLLELAFTFYHRQGESERAVEAALRLAELSPRGPEQAAQMGWFLIQQEEPDAARQLARAALETHPMPEDMLTLVSILSLAHAHLDEPEPALQLMEQLQEQYPEQAAELAYERAMLAHRVGDDQASLRILEQLLEDHPDHAAAANALGYALTRQQRDLDRAERLISQALQARPDDDAILDSMGWVKYKQGDFQAAHDWLQRSYEAGGRDHPIILDHLGDVHYRLEQPDEARDHWQRALQAFDDPRFQLWSDPEMDELPGRLQQKLDALDDEQTSPEIAPTAGEE